MDIIQQFDKAMMDIYIIAKRDLGYNAARFHNMLCEYRGLATAKKLIAQNEDSEGFANLWLMGHLELTVEALVLKEEFKELFTEEEREACRARLLKHGYKFAE